MHSTTGPNIEQDTDSRISLAHFVLSVVEQFQDMLGEHAADPDLADISMRQLNISVPFQEDPDTPLSVLSDCQIFSLAEARAYLLANDRQVLLEYPKLQNRPSAHLSRFNIKIRF